MILRFSIPLLLCLLPVAAHAGATDWQDIAPGVRARLISADGAAQGQTRAGLEIALPPGYKTYWRLAGETGIPTELDFSASAGLGPADVSWPFPVIDETDGYRNFVYHGDVVLPVHLPVTGANPSLDLRVTLGVCSDICIPAEARFLLPVAQQTDQAQAIRLDLAERDSPLAWDRPNPPLAGLRATSAGLEVAGLDPEIDPNSVLVDVGDPALIFGKPQKSPVADIWTLPLLGQGETNSLAGRVAHLTFMTRLGPYAASLQVASGD